MSMKLAISGGNMEITDNNETIVSSNVAKEINDNLAKPDETKDETKAPTLIIKD